MLVSFFPQVCAPWLEAGLGPEGLVPHHWAGSVPSQVCAGMGTLTVVVFPLELASLPSECMRQRARWQWLPQPWSQARLWSEPAQLHPSVLTLLGKGSLHLSGGKTRARVAGSGAPCGLGCALGWLWQVSQSPRQFSVCCFCIVQGLHEPSLGFLQPCSEPHWFSNQLRQLIFLMSDPRAGVPNIWFKPLAPQRESPIL